MIRKDDTDIGETLLKRAPSTRYQGSKRKILPWIYKYLKDLRFQEVLDGFGGTGSVSYLFKLMGKKVTFNDILNSNHQTGIALIENDDVAMTEDDVRYLTRENGFEYPTFIQDTFKDIYYLSKENEWLDVVVHNIHMMSEKYEGDVLKKKRAVAFHALFQACLAKRPYNLFHRKNLYMRTSSVSRNFGNKKTWDTSFQRLFRRYCQEVSGKVFPNGNRNKARCGDIVEMENAGWDLVYLDPPYIKSMKESPIDYHRLYHFLEGMVEYSGWGQRIDHSKKNLRLLSNGSSWEKSKVRANLDTLFKKFQDSTIVVSYGSPGYPSVEEIKELLCQYKKDVVTKRKEYSYRLNHSRKNGRQLYETLIIST